MSCLIWVLISREETQFPHAFVLAFAKSTHKLVFLLPVSHSWQRYMLADCYVSLELHMNKNNLGSEKKLLSKDSVIEDEVCCFLRVC